MITKSDEPLRPEELSALERKVMEKPASGTYRLIQEIHRVRRLANEICVIREGQMTMAGEDPATDQIWQIAKLLLGPRAKPGVVS